MKKLYFGDGEIDWSCPSIDINRPVRTVTDCFRNEVYVGGYDERNRLNDGLPAARPGRVCYPTVRDLRN